MKTCPKCKTTDLPDDDKFCRVCGATLEEDKPASTPAQVPDKSVDDLEFTVTEAPDAGAPELFKQKQEKTEGNIEAGNLEITPNANLLEDETLTSGNDHDNQPKKELIGDSRPPLPLNQDSFDDDNPPPKPPPQKLSSDSGTQSNPNTNSISYKTDRDKSATAENQKKDEEKYTPDWRQDDQIPSKSKSKTKFNSQIQQIKDPAEEAPTIQQSPKVRGVAYFRNNSIKIVGNPFLHDGDEITVNNKQYLLRPKRIDKKTVFGTVGAVCLVMVLILLFQVFNKPALSGKGQIIGLILDPSGKPYLEGARIEIPSIGKSTRSDALGFFKFEMIPPGSYQLTYELGDKYIGSGNATVTDDQMTMMTFNKLEPVVAEKSPSKDQTSSVKSEKTSSAKSKNNDKADSRTGTKSGYGKIKLQANVDNARILVDGKILGAGNNVYSKIKSGKHTIVIDKPGYADYTGTITIEPNKTILIDANLIRNQEPAASDLAAADYLNLGNDAFKSGDFSLAVTDFGKAIELDPSYIEAYESRARALAEINDNEKAANDLVRAGEIYRIKDQHERSIDAFSKALDYSPGNLAALVGRAGAKADKGDYRPGLADYETALDLKDDFYPALYGAGICEFKLGDYKSAEKFFEKAYAQDQSDPYLYHYMMLNYLARDNIQEMRRVYDEFKIIADPATLAEFKSSTRFEPVLRLIKEENRQ